MNYNGVKTSTDLSETDGSQNVPANLVSQGRQEPHTGGDNPTRVGEKIVCSPSKTTTQQKTEPEGYSGKTELSRSISDTVEKQENREDEEHCEESAMEFNEKQEKQEKQNHSESETNQQKEQESSQTVGATVDTSCDQDIEAQMNEKGSVDTLQDINIQILHSHIESAIINLQHLIQVQFKLTLCNLLYLCK